MRIKVRVRSGGLAAIVAVLLSTHPAAVFALDKQPSPTDRPVRFKHYSPTHLTIQDAQQRETPISAEPELSPGAVAAPDQFIMQPSGKFRGIFAGNTYWDTQHDGTCQRQIETGIGTMTGGKRFTHVTWMVLGTQNVNDNFREVDYNAWDPTISGWTLGVGITVTPPGDRGGYAHVDVNTQGNAVLMWHSDVVSAIASSQVTRFAIPGLAIYVTNNLPNLPNQENIYPNGEVGKSAAPNGDIYHVVGEDSKPGPGVPATIAYWRYVFTGGAYVWQGPVPMDNVHIPGYLVLANGNRVILALAKPRIYGLGSDQYNNDLGYYDCADGGAGWIAVGPTPWAFGGGFNCTDYVDSDPHRCFVDLAGGFDSDGRLHLLYTNPGYYAATYTVSIGPCELLHWDEGTPGSNGNAVVSGGTPGGFVGGQEQYFSTVAKALWWCVGDAGRWNRYICKPSLAFGDGSTICNGDPNLDYPYATYTQFGSNDPADKADASAAGYQNGNLWLSISNDQGLSWAAGKCITTVNGAVGGTPTRSPNCDYTTGNPNDYCVSEHWSSSAALVTDMLHVFYLGDLDAGAVVYDEGNWAHDDVMYLRIPGGGSPNPLCPVIAPVLGAVLTADPNCEYYADDDEVTDDEVLSIDNFGNATLNYSATIVYTAPASPPQQWMQFLGYGQSLPPSQIPLAGATHNYTVRMSKGTLPNGVYQAEIRITNNDPTQPPYYAIPVNFFVVDAFFCGSGVVMTTPCVALEVSNLESWGRENPFGGMRYYNETDVDSLFGPFFDGSLTIANKDITGPGGEKIVYRDIFTNVTPSNPGFRALESPIISFNAADNDSVMAANQCTVDSTIGVSVAYLYPQEIENCEFVRILFQVSERDNQSHNLIIGAASDIDAGVDNNDLGGYVESYNLVYQHGTEMVGGNNVTTKYVAGMTALTCNPVKRLKIGSNQSDVDPHNGFTDDYIYTELNTAGHDAGANQADDIHSILAVEDVTIHPGESHVYQLALVTSLAGMEGVWEGNYVYPYAGYVADLVTTAGKAWKKGFGWCGEFWMTSGSYETAPTSDIGWAATGTHEDGINGGCCGCDVTMQVVPPEPSITLVDNGCTGSIHFNNTPVATYTITLTVTDLCGNQADFGRSPAQMDQVQFQVAVVSQCNCGDPWGDLNNDGYLDPIDVFIIVYYTYKSMDCRVFPPGWDCPRNLGDVNCDGFINPADVVNYVKYVFKQNYQFCPNPCF